jgi:predicted alpha-1,2-mannosidase
MSSYWYVVFIISSIVIHVCSRGIDTPLNLYIGTGGDGYGAGSMPIGASSPYGAVRVGPDTSDAFDVPIIFNHFAGYHYSDTHINIFSHTHMFGAGIQDYGEIGIMPVQVEDDTELIRMISVRHAYRSIFHHQNETAQPGYYQVYLDTHKTNVELTATEQVAVHRYSFHSFKQQQVVLIDSSYTLDSETCTTTNVNINSDNGEIFGSIHSEGDLSSAFGGLTTYFVVKFPEFLSNFGTWQDGHIANGHTHADGCSSGAYVILPDSRTGDQQITIYVAISFVSLEQARTNLKMQTLTLQPFDSLRELIQEKWNKEMNRFEVSATWDRDAEMIFNTAIVHSLSSPTQWDESNGVYLGFDKQIHTLPEYMQHFYTDLSIWDIFRTQMPFIVFHDSQRANDIIHSIMLMVEQSDGDLPKWPLANGYTGCMIGSHADILLSDLMMKQEHDAQLNLSQVVQTLRHVANSVQKHDGRFDPATYIRYRYVPYEMDHESAALTLSYAYDDWAIGNVMRIAGLPDEAQVYYNRSLWFENVFDSKSKFFCARNSTGAFKCPTEAELLDPFDDRYVEGDAWHYRFFVPHNTARLIELFGGNESFVHELETFFVSSRPWPSTLLPNPYYWPGNEHDLFSVWQFHYANRSDLTQLHSRWLLKHAYSSKADGLPGNDDYGTMSAWYIFTSIGLYPLAGSSTYLLGSPAFDRISIRRNNGQCTLSIVVHNNSPDNVYVENVLLNGDKLSTFPFIDHVEHLKCSTRSNVQLDFYMSSIVK